MGRSPFGTRHTASDAAMADLEAYVLNLPIHHSNLTFIQNADGSLPFALDIDGFDSLNLLA